jgi:heme exporter protein D
MYFTSLTELFYMGGHGVYVWSVYVVAVIILAILVVTPYLDKRRFLREEAQRIRREQLPTTGA